MKLFSLKGRLHHVSGDFIVRAEVVFTKEEVERRVSILQSAYECTKHNIEEGFKIGAVKYVKAELKELRHIRAQLLILGVKV